MNEINQCVTRIQEELNNLRELGLDVRNLEKEIYELSIPEVIPFEQKLYLRKVSDPSIPEGKSTTYGVFINNLQEEAEIFISLNSKEDLDLGLETNELNVWNTEDGSLYIMEI
jgi:hypothetical protein